MCVVVTLRFPMGAVLAPRPPRPSHAATELPCQSACVAVVDAGVTAGAAGPLGASIMRCRRAYQQRDRRQADPSVALTHLLDPALPLPPVAGPLQGCDEQPGC